MKKSKLKKGITIGMTVSMLSLSSICFADNPIVQTIYTSDPAPMVYNDTLYVYTGHDEDNSDYYTMNEWRCYSTKDMQNWTDLGSPLSFKDFSWVKGDAWAAQCVERNGKFYMYVPVTTKQGGTAIGVAVADKPEGPFKDAIGKALIPNGFGNIDPTVYIDTDGQAYLYWGNPQLKYVKLNKDMTSYSGNITDVPLTAAGFGERKNHETRNTLYEEAPWFYKRGNLYYMLFAANLPEFISYSTSTSPTGPWTYRGVIMPSEGRSFTNHPGIVDFKGKSYFFYHNGALPGGSGFDRSVAVEEFNYNPDGSIPTIKMSNAGPKQIESLNPYVRNEAETICFESGVETEKCSEGGVNVGFIDNNDYIKVKGVNFGSGAKSFEARVASAGDGGNIEIHLDSLDGKIIGTCKVDKTGGWQEWMTKSCEISNATGVHDVYFKFTGGSGSLFNVNWWKFISTSGEEKPSEEVTKPNTNYATLKDGWYYIKNTGSQKYLQVAGDKGGDGVNVEISAGSGSVGQKWYLTNVGEGYFTLKNGHGYMLDLVCGLDEDTTNIQTYTANGLTAQQFKVLTTSKDKVYGIVTKASTDVRGLDIFEKGTADGSNVQQYFYYGADNQTWTFETSPAPDTSEPENPTPENPTPDKPNPDKPSDPTTGEMAKVSIASDWGDGATADMTITNLTGKALNGWTCTFTTNRSITSIWNATLVSQKGNTYTVSNPDWKPNLATGESYTFGCSMGSGPANVTVTDVTLK